MRSQCPLRKGVRQSVPSCPPAVSLWPALFKLVSVYIRARHHANFTVLTAHGWLELLSDAMYVKTEARRDVMCLA